MVAVGHIGLLQTKKQLFRTSAYTMLQRFQENRTRGDRLDLYLNTIKDLLLNIFFIVTFIFTYNKFIQSEISNKKNKLLVLSTSSILILLCMTFPVPFYTGHIFDLRQVPFIIGALYGGRKVAVMLLLILVSYRFYIGGEGFYGALTTNVLLLASLWYIIPLFNRLKSIAEKVRTSIVAGLLGILWMSIVISVGFPTYLTGEFLIFLVIFLIIQCFAVSISVYFFEKTKVDMVMAQKIKKLEKLNTVSEIAASISHEVRNPLTTTRGFIQLLQDPHLTEEKKHLYIKHSLQELDRATNIISDYLSFAKPSLENTERLNLCEELQYVKTVLKPYANINNVIIKMNIGEKHVYIIGEAQKLRQCIINLVKNGVEAMPQGGELTIVLGQKEKHAILSITDQGIGMDKGQMSKLGTPYYSTKTKGTGLGTMVSYSIVESMGGNIQVESTIGKGTTFTLTFPSVN